MDNKTKASIVAIVVIFVGMVVSLFVSDELSIWIERIINLFFF